MATLETQYKNYKSDNPESSFTFEDWKELLGQSLNKVLKTYKFYKDSDGWFVDLPESNFSKMELEMVAGADTFCDILAHGESEVYVTLSETPFEGCEVLQFTNIGRLEGFEIGEGAWYFLNEYQGVSYCIKMWLCDVTKYLFGDFPNKIYFK